MNEVDRAFWLAIYRAVCAIAAAIKKHKVDLHVQFAEEETVHQFRELKPEPGREPFVKLR